VNRAYYNENDRFAAACLRELIEAGHLPGGDVDERDVQLVEPADLATAGHCHFFAGIGGWQRRARCRVLGAPDVSSLPQGARPSS